MQNAGFKIVDKNEPMIVEIVNQAKKQKIPIELGLYFDNQSIRESVRGFSPLNIHFNHRIMPLITIDETFEAFESVICVAKDLGATYGIQHISASPMTSQKLYWKEMFASLINACRQAETLCRVHDFAIYIENTYESIDFYRTLFDDIRQQGFNHIHFCFDIGHAKIWSGETFEMWMAFLLELKNKKFKLHFHLHANRGLRDEHLSFIEMEEMGFDGNDGVFSDKTYAQMLQEINNTFPQARKIFEVKASYAKQNLEWVSQVTSP